MFLSKVNELNKVNEAFLSMIDQFNCTKATRAKFGKVHVFADFI